MKSFELLSFASRLIEQYDSTKSQICKKYNVPHTAFDVMMFLHNHPNDNTAKDICEKRGIKSGIVSVVLKKLVSDEYIIKQSDGGDRRIQRLYLTNKSASLVADGSEMQQAFYGYLLEDVTEEERAIYNDVTYKILEQIVALESGGTDFA